MLIAQSIIVFSLISFLRYFVIAGFFYYFFWVKKNSFTEEYSHSKTPFSKQQMLFEFRNSIVTSLIFGVVLGVCFYESIQLQPIEFINQLSVDIIWQLPLLVFIHETYFYWAHRLLHRPLLFKKIHSVHHKSKNTTPWASFSFHPLEALIMILWVVPAQLLNFNIGAWFLFGFVTDLINVIGHSNIDIYPQSFKTNKLLNLINLPENHSDHHAYNKGSFGLYFSIWDKLFKTENKA